MAASRRRRTDAEILDEIKTRKAQLEAREQVVAARMQKKQRAIDTRRKILMGSFVLHLIETEPERCAEMFAFRGGKFPLLGAGLDGFLRQGDRKLFADLLADDAAGEGEAEQAAVKEEPDPVWIWTADAPAIRPGRDVYAETPHRSEVFATGIRTEFGGGWDKLAKRWYAAAEHYDQVVTLARRCYPKVVELEQPPTG